MDRINKDYGNVYDGYFVFDADNILEQDYIEKMNQCFNQGNQIITSYRNSKNYGANWISAGYGLWFLRESRYLNNAREIIHSSCAVSGTGFLFSKEIFPLRIHRTTNTTPPTVIATAMIQMILNIKTV